MAPETQSDFQTEPDSKWMYGYQDVLVSAQEAVTHIQSGQRVFLGTGCGQPQALIDALLTRTGQLQDIEIIHLLTFEDSAYRHGELAQAFRLSRFFIAEAHNGQGQACLRDYIPISLSDIPRLFTAGQLPLDIALIQVTPPNEHGLCSLGISVDITKSAAENAGLVIAQINPHMPWTSGDSLISMHDIDYCVWNDRPLLEITMTPPSDTARQIADYVAALIPDGSTLELGTRQIPRAVLEVLRDKQDLGLHTEVLNDAMIDLIEAGVFTGKRKSADRGKVVATLCMGTQRLYDYIDQNPLFCLRPAELVSDPYLVSQHRNMIALSVGVEVDLTGQVCAYSPVGGFSGMGSRNDFVHGAVHSPGGKIIVALESSRDQDTRSRIVPVLHPGAGVALTSHEVHYVVTEHGVAFLHGKNLQERALALISVAHPNFRAELLQAAIETRYVSPDLAGVGARIQVGLPAHQTSMVLDNGTQIHFRAMHLTDEERVRELFYHVSKESMYYRFMSHTARLPRKQIQDYVYIDYRSEMAIVATLPEAHGEDIVAVGRYYLIPPTNRAEVAFIVRDQWQNQGIGTFLLEYLTTIAKRNGITGFTAEVLTQNRAMLAVLQKSGKRISSHADGSVYSITLDFD